MPERAVRSGLEPDCRPYSHVVPGPVGYAGALVAGFAASLQLILIMSLPPVVTEETNVARLTAGITLVGYLLAFVLPLLGGLLSDTIGGIAMVFIPTAVFILVLAGLGRKDGRYEEQSSNRGTDLQGG